MNANVVYEPRPPYVVQVWRWVAPLEPLWVNESYHFTEQDAQDSANFLALSNAQVRVVMRESP